MSAVERHHIMEDLQVWFIANLYDIWKVPFREAKEQPSRNRLTIHPRQRVIHDQQKQS